MEDSELIQKLEAALLDAQSHELQSFHPVEDSGLTGEAVYTHRFAPETVAFESALRLVCGAFGATEEHCFDKTAWIFHFSANGQRCCLRYTRSGIKLDLYAPLATQDDALAIAKRVKGQLITAAGRIYRRVIAPEGKHKMETGDVMLFTQTRYRDMVDFYLDELRSALPKPPEATTEPTADASAVPIETIFHDLAQRRQLEHARVFRSAALVAGYFSWVQHLLVRLTAFSPRALGAGFSVTALLDAPWAEQFDAAYPAATLSTNRLKSDLTSLARDFRNPLLHGGDRMADGVVIEWAPGQWTTLIDPFKPTDAYMLWQPALSEGQVNDLLARIDRIDCGFKAHPFYDWVANALPVRFGAEHVNKALHAIATNTVAQYTEAEDRAFDKAVNWD